MYVYIYTRIFVCKVVSLLGVNPEERDSVCMYTNICIHVYIYVCVCVCVYVPILAYIYMEDIAWMPIYLRTSAINPNFVLFQAGRS